MSDKEDSASSGDGSAMLKSLLLRVCEQDKDKAVQMLDEDAAKKTPEEVNRYEDSELKWRKEGYERINSLALMDDGSCLLTAAVGQTENPNGLVTFDTKTVQRLSSSGKPTELPFPCFATRPKVIYVNHTSTTMLLVDDKGKDFDEVSVYSKHGARWQCRSFNSQRNIDTIAATQDGCIVCTAVSGPEQTLVIMSLTGQEEWSLPLPQGCNRTHISVSNHRIIVSSGNSDTVMVISLQGEPLHTVPSAFIRYPRGVTSDHVGRLIIADAVNNAISLFTHEGDFIKTLVKCQQRPVYVSLSQNRFLLVGEYNQEKLSWELCLYELFQSKQESLLAKHTPM